LTGQEALRSAVYQGTVLHHRPAPAYGFTQRIAVPLLFTHELRMLSELHPLAHFDPERPAHRFRPLRLVRSDFLTPHDVPIDRAVATYVEAAGGTVRGPVAVLGQVRTWGWLFNPLTMYFCFDATGQKVEWTVLEVTNTPWHERHCYVIGPPGAHRVEKELHVSPFLPMSALYDIKYSAPGHHLSVRFEVLCAIRHEERSVAGAESMLSVSMHLRRQPLNRRTLERLLWRTPAMTTRVSAGIYARAVALALRRATFYSHPRRGQPPTSDEGRVSWLP
jgi:uncharacterized protein